MESANLEDYLEIIFNNEENDLKTKHYSFNIRGFRSEYIDYPNAKTLVQIYSMLGNDTTLKSTFIEKLANRISDTNEITIKGARGENFYVSVSALCFYALIELGNKDKAIESLKKRQSGFNLIHLLLNAILGIIPFNFNQLKEITSIANDSQHNSDFQEALQTKIAKTRFELLTTQIKGKK